MAQITTTQSIFSYEGFAKFTTFILRNQITTLAFKKRRRYYMSVLFYFTQSNCSNLEVLNILFFTGKF